MGTVTFIDADGNRITAKAQVGDTIMQVARSVGVEGIVADCGGCLSCATCHVYLEAGWADKVPAASAEELEMVEGAIDVQHNSRLSCQITYTDDLDGIEIRIPATQY